MAQLIAPNKAGGDSVKVVEDKTRALAANQGLNESDMWTKIDTEIASAASAGYLLKTEAYPTSGSAVSVKHGNK